MSPIVDGLAKDFGDRVAFQRLDARREGAELFRQYRLRGHPSYVIIDRSGKIAWQRVGVVSRQELEDALQQVLK